MKDFEEYLDKMGYSWNDFDRTYEMANLIEQYADERVIKNYIEPLQKQISMMQIEIEGLKSELIKNSNQFSLRDKFAMMAISGYTSATNQEGTWTSDGCEVEMAQNAYRIADEMINARIKTKDK